MGSFVLPFEDIGKNDLMVVGGKGAHLGELSHLEGIQVPDGFCITTEAFARVVAAIPSFEGLLERLADIESGDSGKIAEVSAAIRTAIEAAPIPDEISEAIGLQLSEQGEVTAYAVRSSATAEDLPTASFAGQQDTYLNVVGKEEIFRHIGKCWASLFTERAVAYRIQNGFDHRAVQLAVVVQQMVFPEVSGILFTADPVTSNRKVLSIDASFGLGESLVSGLVNPDVYKVRDGEIVEKKIGAKTCAVSALPSGGTEEQAIEVGRQEEQALSDGQILQLELLGRKIEQYFGCPQDIEWCYADGVFSVVQSRPITTLYPLPEVSDEDWHVWVSVGHQQMMTDAMKPLGISFYRLTSGPGMREAGGRLFVDVAQTLASPERRKPFLAAWGHSDVLIQDALSTLAERMGGAHDGEDAPSAEGEKEFEVDPSIVSRLIEQSESAIESLKHAIEGKSGVALFDFIHDDVQRMKKTLFDPESMKVIMTTFDAAAWVNEKMEEWLGEKNAVDVLTQSVPNNPTSAMGFALMDVADEIRPYPEIIAYLEQSEDRDFLDGMLAFEGGKRVQEAFSLFLRNYGMRCSGEIDITRTRWSENPLMLIPAILNNVKNFEPEASKRLFERGRAEAAEKEKDLLERLKQLPDGKRKAAETERAIKVIRAYSGYREYPKFGIIKRYFIYKMALLEEAERLVNAGILWEKEDAFFLSFEEFQQTVSTNELDYAIVGHRKEAYEEFKKLMPPRVMTSDGEVVTGTYRKEGVPEDAFAGLAVSSGVVEGRARVILNMEDAVIGDDDILVTTFTDPSWTPLFVSLKGLVTEVGGLMSHGAVIAREYGLPAVVGVVDATKHIKDGQRIRLSGTEGYVEVL